MRTYCRHRDCQLEAQVSLLWLYARTRRADILDEAMKLRAMKDPEVQCQRSELGRESRTGAPNAPLPTKEVTHG